MDLGKIVPGTRSTPSKRRRRSSLLLKVVLVVFLVAAAPAMLTLLYAIDRIHPVSTLMIADLVTGKGYDREWIGIDAMSPVLVRSIMMSEDGQYCRHHGVDLGEMREVVRDTMAGEETRGASTITMQSVKNLFLWPVRSVVRKAIELPYAVFMDAVLPKRRIMEIYLNIVEFGEGLYGVEAAARRYFDRSASNLTARQAARLAITLPSPSTRNPDEAGGRFDQLVRLIERRAHGSGAYDDCLPGG